MVQTLQLLAVLALCQVGEVLFPNLADLESPTPRDISTEAETNLGSSSELDFVPTMDSCSSWQSRSVGHSTAS